MTESLKQIKSAIHFINYIQPLKGCSTAVILFENRTARELLLNKHYISPWQISLLKTYGYGVITVVPKRKEATDIQVRHVKQLSDLLASLNANDNHVIGYQESCKNATVLADFIDNSNLILFSPKIKDSKILNIPKSTSTTVYLDQLTSNLKIKGDKVKLISCNGLGHQTYQYFQIARGLDSIIHKNTSEVETLINRRVHTGIYQKHYNRLAKSDKNVDNLSIPDFNPQWRNQQILRHTDNVEDFLIDQESHKVFSIGFHKTGTTSINKALKELGYRIKSHYGTQNKRIKHDWLFNAIPLLNGHSAFEDMPWPINYKLWDKLYPNAKFILTQRETLSWYNSVCKYFGSKPTETRKWIYGENKFNPLTNKQHYIDTYESHNQGVLDYFKNRPDKLLVYNLVKGDGWKPLCQFLKKEIPKEPFPHSNKTEKKQTL